MTNEKKKKGMHLKKKVKVILCLLLGIGLEGFGGYNLYDIYKEADEMKSVSCNEVKEYTELFTSAEKTDPEVDLVAEQPEIQPEEQIGNGQVVGVLYIPSFNNFRHCIALGVEDGVIANYVGMYRSYGTIGQPNSNTVLAAHSSMYGYSPIAFFNGIEKFVKSGDEISVLWNDGNTYKYIVDSVKTHVEQKDRTAFEQPADNESEYLTLQTCTFGDPNLRTYIRAKRV